MQTTTPPLPALRSTIRVTVHGGYQRTCPCGGTAWSWAPAVGACVYQPKGDGVACGRPYTDGPLDWVEQPPRTRTGKVAQLLTSTTGAPLVLLSQPGTRVKDCLPWTSVISVEVL